jgi:murein L,D-transpeptidase YcbB/YkuD
VSDRLAEILRERRDLRIKYVISNRRIYSGTNQKNPAWVWRPYAGKNPHTHHVHVSVKEDPIFFDDERLWELDNFKPTTEQMKAPFPTPKPVLRLGSEGLVVTQLQELLSIYVDGRFGIETLQAVKAFQLKNSLTPDGIVGKYTWEALTALKGEVDK